MTRESLRKHYARIMKAFEFTPDREIYQSSKMIIDLLNQTEWVPVSKRLPKEHRCDDGYVEPSDYVLVLGDYGSYGVSRYWGNRRSKSESPNTCKDWVDLDWVVQKPISWMPLPEPYEGGE